MLLACEATETGVQILTDHEDVQEYTTTEDELVSYNNGTQFFDITTMAEIADFTLVTVANGCQKHQGI